MALLPAPRLTRRRLRPLRKSRNSEPACVRVESGRPSSPSPRPFSNTWRRSVKPHIVHPAFRRGSRLWSRQGDRQQVHEGVNQTSQECPSTHDAKQSRDRDSRRPIDASQSSIAEFILRHIQFHDNGNTLHLLLQFVEGTREISFDAVENGYCIVFPTPLITVVPGRDLTRVNISDDEHVWKVVLQFVDSETEVFVPRGTDTLITMGNLPLTFV